jgi:hypothetical protein
MRGSFPGAAEDFRRVLQSPGVIHTPPWHRTLEPRGNRTLSTSGPYFGQNSLGESAPPRDLQEPQKAPFCQSFKEPDDTFRLG